MKSRREILLHPVRMQILQYLAKNGGATPGELSEALPDVPRTTLYRHVNLLHSEDYLKVTKEVKIRGTYEREYEVNPDVMHGRTAKEKERQDVFNMLLKMLGDFEDYYERPDSDSEKDMLFFTGNTLKLSDGEFSRFLQELFALLAKYDVLSESADQKTRSITMISAPVVEVPEKVQGKNRREESRNPQPEETERPRETLQNMEAKQPEEARQDAETQKPAETQQFAESVRAGETRRTAEVHSKEPEQPKETPRAVEAVQPEESRSGARRGEPEARPGVFQEQPDNRPLRQVVQVNKKPVQTERPRQESTEPVRRTGNRMTFRQAMEKISGSFRITDTASHGGIFDMPVDATYDMVDKVKNREPET